VLDPSIISTGWTLEEDELLVELHAQLGNEWAKISRRLPGRTVQGVTNRMKQIAKLRAKMGPASFDLSKVGQTHSRTRYIDKSKEAADQEEYLGNAAPVSEEVLAKQEEIVDLQKQSRRMQSKMNAQYLVIDRAEGAFEEEGARGARATMAVGLEKHKIVLEKTKTELKQLDSTAALPCDAHSIVSKVMRKKVAQQVELSDREQRMKESADRSEQTRREKQAARYAEFNAEIDDQVAQLQAIEAAPLSVAQTELRNGLANDYSKIVADLEEHERKLLELADMEEDLPLQLSGPPQVAPKAKSAVRKLKKAKLALAPKSQTQDWQTGYADIDRMIRELLVLEIV